MRITIGEKTKEFMTLLMISEYPFASDYLRQQFRKRIKEVHTDKGGDNNQTRRVIEAYKALKNLALDFKKEASLPEKSQDIFDLSKPCKECNGIGRIPLPGFQRGCPDCSRSDSFFSMFSFYSIRGRGFHSTICKECNGIGLNKRRKECPACNGSGRSKTRCKTCKGTGVWAEDSKFIECPICNGKGRIQLNPFNPVIPKGAVLTS